MAKKVNNQIIDDWITNNRPQTKRIGVYTYSKTPIEFQCECGNHWYITFNNFQRGLQCKECGKEKHDSSLRISNEDIDNWIKINRPNTKRVGNYINAREPISFQCECGEIWKTYFSSFKLGTQCSKCRNEKRSEKLSKTTVQYEKDCLTYECKPLEEYKGSHTPIKHMCLECKTIFITTPTTLLSLHKKCPKCKRKKSKYELFVESILKENNISYEFSYDMHINNHYHYFDFHIKDLNLFIEVDGEGHYYPVNFNGISDEEAQEAFQNRRIRDAEKDMFCHWNKHNLLRLPYFLSKDEIIQQLEAALKGE